MNGGLLRSGVALLLTTVGALAQTPAAAGSPSQGVALTLERLGPAEQRVVQVERTRLLSLAVERGESPSPFLPAGMWQATFRAKVTLPARDKCRFRLEGRGGARLSVGGQMVLEGTLRLGKPIETEAKVALKKGANDLELVFTSGPMGDGQVRLFWSGEDFGFEPIAPELLSFVADDELLTGELRRRGQTLFGERRCANCHEAEAHRNGESAYGELAVPAPDLRTAGTRLRREWLAAWLRDPHALRATATMPKLAFENGGDADDLAAYLAEQGTPGAIDPFTATEAAAGADRFRRLGCVGCHVPPGEDAHELELGPRIALDGVTHKWHPAALVAFLLDPRRDHPATGMPDFRLSPAEARELAAYVATGAGAALPASRGDATRGKHLAQQHHCAQCHAIDLPQAEYRALRGRNLHADHGCLAEAAEQRGRAPDFALSVDDRAALRAFLPHAEEAPFRTAPFDFAQRHLVAERCTACHAIDGRASVWARAAELAGADHPLPPDQDPRTQGVPALTWVGSKLQPTWITQFVTGQLPSPRPWLKARMPAFHLRGAAIAAGLVREHGYGTADEPPGNVDVQLASDGQRLVAIGTGFACVNCHAVAGQPAVQVFEREGIDLATARGRLRHEYYTRWLADPRRLDPDSKMPKFADAKGKTAFKDVLDGDAARQFEAIWHFLGQRRGSR